MDRERSRQGFTLAELLAAIAIIAILAAFGFVAVVQHQRNLKLAEDDSIARELYLAAQNNLTGLLADGTWEKKIKEEPKNYFGISLDGSSAPDGSKIEGEHDFFRILVNQGNVGGAPESGKTAWDDAILPAGSIDDTIRSGGSYLIDYDRKTAQVFAVFYTDRTHGIFLQAGDGTLTSEDAASLYQLVSGSTGGSRKHYTSHDGNLSDVCVGYYGGAVAAGDTGNGNTDDTALPKATLTLSNAEELTLSGTLDWGNYTSGTLHCKIVVHGETSGKAVDVVGSENLLASQKGIGPIVLDSVTESGKHFGKQFANGESGLINGENVYCTLETQDGTVLATSNSENSLFASVTRADGSGNPLAVTVANGRQLENLSQEISGITTVTDAVLIKDIDWSTFAGNSAADGQKTIYGFQNDALNAPGSYIGIASYTLSSFDGRGHAISNLVIGTNNGKDGSNTISNQNAGLFSRIANAKDSQTQRENFTVKDLKLSAPSISSSTGEGSCGFLIGSVNADEKLAVSLSNIAITSPTGSVSGGSSLGGLIGYVGKGTVGINACSVGGTVSLANNDSATGIEDSRGAVGGLIGSVSATGSCSIEIQNSNVTGENGSKLTSNTGSAGGILGCFFVERDNGSTALTLDGVKVDAARISAISGAGSAGALAGYLGAEKITISDCTVNGLSSVTAEQGSAGGEVGTIAASVSSYQQTGGTFAPNQDSYTVTAESGSAGGLIGTSAAASFTLEPGTNGSVTGIDTVTITGNTAGGIVGTLEGNFSGSLSYAALSAKAAAIHGSQYAGGILGYGKNSSTQDDALQFVGNSVQCGNLTVGGNSAQNSAGGMIGSYEGNLSLRSLTLRVASALSGNEDTESAGILSIQAGQNAGGLAGSLQGNTVSLNTVTINGGDNAKSTVTGGTTAGGLVGTVASSKNLSVTGAAVSTYVYQSGNGENAAAGGLIGSVSAEKADIASSYVGGRTYDKNGTSGQYDENTDSHDHQGRFNVWSDGGAGSAAGGFLGKLDSTNLTITNCYTTASVYSKDSSSYAGGFIGMADGNSSGKIKNTYATGLVSSTEGTKGCYAGSVGSGFSGASNYYLGGINLSVPAMGSENGKLSVAAVSTGKEFLNGEIVATTPTKAGPYDKSLGISYPLKTTAQLAGEDGGYHMGDWPIPSSYEIELSRSFLTVDFVDEKGTRLVSPVFVVKDGLINKKALSASMEEAEQEIGKENFDHWVDENGNTITADNDLWNSAIGQSMTIRAVTKKSGYLSFYYVDPNKKPDDKNRFILLGIRKYDSEKGADLPVLPEFKDYVQSSWYSDAALQNAISNVSKDPNKFLLPSDTTTDKVYLTYQPGGDSYKVTLELRANSEGANYPLLSRYSYEIKEGNPYDLTVNLPSNEKLNGLTLSTEPLKIKNTTEDGKFTLDALVSEDASSVDKDKNLVKLKGNKAATYVVLYNGKPVSYTVHLVYANTALSADGKLIFDKENSYELTKKGTGFAGTFVNISDYKNEIGFTASGPDNLYLQNDETKNIATINLTRNQHILAKDSGGAVFMQPVRLYYGQSLWGTENDNGLLTSETARLQQSSKTGYHLSDEHIWGYQTQGSNGNTTMGEDVPVDAVMPDNDVTVAAKWEQNVTASYTVEIWQQKRDQQVDEDRSSKTVGQISVNDYDFFETFTISDAETGSTPDWLKNKNSINKFVSSHIGEKTYSRDFKFFDLNINATTGFNANKTVQADGSTVYQIFYDREIITLNFYGEPDVTGTEYVPLYLKIGYTDGLFSEKYYYASISGSYPIVSYTRPKLYGLYPDNSAIYTNINNSNDYIRLYKTTNTDKWTYNTKKQQWEFTRLIQTYKGLYGQDLPDEAKQKFVDKTWHQESSNTTLTMLASFIPPDDSSTIDLTYNGKNEDNSIGVRHYKEKLDGSLVDSFDYYSSGGTFNITDKYYGYHAYAYMNSFYDPPILDKQNLNKDTKDNVSYGSHHYVWGGTYNDGTLCILHRRTTGYIYLENINSTRMDLEKFYRINGTRIDQDPAEYRKSQRFFDYDENGYDGVIFEEKLADLNLPGDEKLDSATYMPKSLDKYGDTTGYTFGGWYKSADFKEQIGPDDIMPNHNIRLYAKWNAPTYTVTYHVGDNTFTETLPKYGNITVRTNDDLVLKKHGVTGYKLEGWYTSSDLDPEHLYINSTEITNPIDLYAKMVPEDGSQIQVKVDYIQDNTDGTTKVLGTDTVTLTIGESYTIGFRDFDGAIPTGSPLTGIASPEMANDTKPLELHYIPDIQEPWTYHQKSTVIYQDINSSAELEATLDDTIENSTTAGSILVYGNVKQGYLTDDYSITVDRQNSTADFVYSPDYTLRSNSCVAVFYDGMSHEGDVNWKSDLIKIDDLPVPNGYRFDIEVSYLDDKGNPIVQPNMTSAGTIKVDYTLKLVSVSNPAVFITLYRDSTSVLRILKRPVILASGDLTVPYDGNAHSLEGVKSVWTSEDTAGIETGFVGTDGDGITYFDFRSINEVGTAANTFHYQLKEGVNEDNYDIQCVYGSLTVTSGS